MTFIGIKGLLHFRIRREIFKKKLYMFWSKLYSFTCLINLIINLFHSNKRLDNIFSVKIKFLSSLRVVLKSLQHQRCSTPQLSADWSLTYNWCRAWRPLRRLSPGWRNVCTHWASRVKRCAAGMTCTWGPWSLDGQTGHALASGILLHL